MDSSAGTPYPKVKIKKEPFKNQLKMQIDINNIQQMVADAVRDAVAPLYEQMREIENKYYPNEKLAKQVPQQPEEPQKRC